MGLAVSFNECFKRDTRCNANNISRKISTFQADSSTHNASDVLLYCTEQLKEAEILLTTPFDYSTKLYLKYEAILTNPEFLLNAPHFCLETSITMTTELKLLNALQS